MELVFTVTEKTSFLRTRKGSVLGRVFYLGGLSGIFYLYLYRFDLN